VRGIRGQKGIVGTDAIVAGGDDGSGANHKGLSAHIVDVFMIAANTP